MASYWSNNQIWYLSHFESFAKWNIFNVFDVVFLAVSHLYKDSDEDFSKSFEHLWSFDAVAWTILHSKFCRSYDNPALMVHMTSAVT